MNKFKFVHELLNKHILKLDTTIMVYMNLLGNGGDGGEGGGSSGGNGGSDGGKDRVHFVV